MYSLYISYVIQRGLIHLPWREILLPRNAKVKDF
jgi:hypothetical protein